MGASVGADPVPLPVPVPPVLGASVGTDPVPLVGASVGVGGEVGAGPSVGGEVGTSVGVGGEVGSAEVCPPVVPAVPDEVPTAVVCSPMVGAGPVAVESPPTAPVVPAATAEVAVAIAGLLPESPEAPVMVRSVGLVVGLEGKKRSTIDMIIDYYYLLVNIYYFVGC